MPFYELTHWAPLMLSVVLLTVTAGYAIVWVPRRRGPGPGKYIEQMVVLVLVTLLTVLILFLKLNGDNQWYSSWADLVARGAPSPATVTVFGAPPDRVDAPARMGGGRFTARQEDPRSNPDVGAQVDPGDRDGQWVSLVFTGPTTGVTGQLVVWLPPSYLAHPDRAYPVLTAFTGYPGTPQTYTQSVRYDQIVRQEVARGKLREPIVVIPDVYPSGQDTECVDGPGGRYESWVAVDVVGWVKKNLRTADDAQAWATVGYSAGGWCATMFSVRHPGQWARSINLAGYFAPDFHQGQQWGVPGDPRYDLGAIVAEHHPPVDIWFFSGGDDEMPLRSLAAFRSTVTAPTSLVLNITDSGGHRAAVWQPAMAESLVWLGTTSAYFAPEGRPSPVSTVE